ncbi:hypothetical protein [uncultured Jatrophihabitans sp.]|uniref:hypothetical protein n=1 Tax=uncultured Jatrophihabitans sp. TaxID=1610747 RepID=UPI0035CBC675
MLDVAIRKADGSSAVDWRHVGVRAVPPLPVADGLRAVLPDGLRRGSTVSVRGSTSLLLALLGAASAGGGWCALVGFPRISAEAAREYGVELRRLALIPAPGEGWATAVGALLDAVDIVAVRPPRGRGLSPGDVRRLAARARSKDAVLVPYLGAADNLSAADNGAQWPGADVRLSAEDGVWSGLGQGAGRLRARQVRVSAAGRGQAARPRSTTLWLPADGGGVLPAAPIASPVIEPVIDLAG